MAWTRPISVLSLVLVTSSLVWSACVPGDTCKAPNCRCWNDPQAPGGYATADIPQMVLVSFAYGINKVSADLYTSLFKGISNPNKCEPRATFFVQSGHSDLNVISGLAAAGHEIGITTVNGTVPPDASSWTEQFSEVKMDLKQVGIDPAKILGCRAPKLEMGGDDQVQAMKSNGLTYDSSCVSSAYMEQATLIWPFTYDFVDQHTPACDLGKAPKSPSPGTWQFLIADLEFKGHKCVTPSGCTPFFVNDTQPAQRAYDLLYDAFAKHYNSKTRSPFLLYLDPAWLYTDAYKDGTKQFLQFIRAAFKDTWIVTTQQALAWIKQPVKAKSASSFGPWKC